MSGGMMSVVVAANNQLVLGHVHVWSFRCTCLRFFKCGDRLRRSHGLGGLFFNLSFQCQFLGCFLSGEESACHMFQLSCIPTFMPLPLHRLVPFQVLWRYVWSSAVACGIMYLLCRQLSSWWDVHCSLFVQS